jgi:osmotically-inducible protein OsmY
MKLPGLILIGAALFLDGCSPISFFSSGVATLDTTSQERGLGGYVTDTEIQTRLNVVLFEHDHVLHHRININVYEGRVLLTGRILTKKMQEDAVRLAWHVPGVKTVIDDTTIGEPRSLLEYAKDKWISTKLNTLLFVESTVSSRNYEIVVVDGVVYLVGVCRDKKELDQIIEICRTTKHVKKVISYVRLMNLLEKRRRKIFNTKKQPSPLERAQILKEKKLRPHKNKGSWIQTPRDLSNKGD